MPAWDVPRPGWFPHDFDWVIGCTHTGVPAEPAPIRNAIGANMSFRAQELRESGGFSESLGRIGSAGAGCEETEASIRVTQQHPQGMVWYEPAAVVAHRVTPNRGTWTYFPATLRRRGALEGDRAHAVRRAARHRARLRDQDPASFPSRTRCARAPGASPTASAAPGPSSGVSS